MKISQFNSYIHYREGILYYNSLSNQYLYVDPFINDLLQSAKKVGNLQELAELHSEFYNILVEYKFIVEDHIDEVEEVKKRANEMLHQDDVFLLTINPTMNCNFKCWYCYETHLKDSKMTLETIDKTNAFIDKILSRHEIKRLNISWFGGEPLLYYKAVVLPIMRRVKNLVASTDVELQSNMTTNGYLVKESMFEEFREIGLTSFQITLDGSPKDHNKVRFVSKERGSFDEITTNIMKLCEEGFSVAARINYTKDNVSELHEIIPYFRNMTPQGKRKIIFSFHQVWQDVVNDIDQEIITQMDLFKAAGFGIASNHAPNNVENPCYADMKNSAVINYNGELFKCTARDFTTKNKEGDLDDDGSMFWNEKAEERLNSKFKNKPCLSCRLLPICNGGCSQVALEHKEKEYCVYNFDEKKKDNMLLIKFLQEQQIPA